MNENEKAHRTVDDLLKEIRGYLPPEPYFSDRELRALVLATAAGSAARGGATDADIDAVNEWANLTRLGGVLLDQVLSGKLLTSVVNGEVVFDLPTPAIENGLRKALGT